MTGVLLSAGILAEEITATNTLGLVLIVGGVGFVVVGEYGGVVEFLDNFN